MSTDSSSVEKNKKTVTGGCHCGKIKYTATIPLPLTATRCNCTFCQKLSTTNLTLDPADFTLLAPSSSSPGGGGKQSLPNYQPRVKSVDRYFCDLCGVHVWMEGFFEVGGHRHDLFMLNLVSVDQPQQGVDLSEVTLKYYGLLQGDFTGGLRDQPWPCGLP